MSASHRLGVSQRLSNSRIGSQRGSVAAAGGEEGGLALADSGKVIEVKGKIHRKNHHGELTFDIKRTHFSFIPVSKVCFNFICFFV